MKKILIVEDDMIINMVNTMYVKKFGYEVSGNAKSGREAIELALKHKPDIILMDIKIKGEIDGIETMVEISKFSDAKVIYVTGNSDELLRKRAAMTNIVGFCVKPMSMEELKTLLGKV
ncbi:MAG: CheY-like receiver protein [Bacteroidetes bacterium]|nr:CheY-like receiver protein [Bacteroidota bacterium]